MQNSLTPVIHPSRATCQNCGQGLSPVATRFGLTLRCTSCDTPTLLRCREILQLHRDRCRDPLFCCAGHTAFVSTDRRLVPEPRSWVSIELHARTRATWASPVDERSAICCLSSAPSDLVSSAVAELAAEGIRVRFGDPDVYFDMRHLDSAVECLRQWLLRQNQRAAVAPEVSSAGSENYVSLRLPPESVIRFFGDNRDEFSTCERDDLMNKVSTALDCGFGSKLPLRSYQRDALRFIARAGGRALVGDEMGTGKTLTAIASMAAMDRFPLLVVVPASSRVHWAEEFEKWLRVPPEAIHIIWDSNTKPMETCPTSNSQSPSSEPMITITSYNMAVRLRVSLTARSWAGIICDESHVLRSPYCSPGPGHEASRSSQRLETVRELVRTTRCVLLLSGTPSLVRAADLFDQVDMLRPALLGSSLLEFGVASCVVEISPYLRFGKCHRFREVSGVLRSTVLLRTRKVDALPELPAKTRTFARLLVEQPARAETFQEQYHAIGKAKQAAALDVVIDKLSTLRHEATAHTDEVPRAKIVVFAHHVSVLDYAASRLCSARIGFARIDGSVTGPARSSRIRAFSQDSRIEVALLGITACGVGIALPVASVCIFLELPPDAGWLVQAEDRLHRPGQNNNVSSMLCVAIGSDFDARHASRVIDNLSAINQLVDEGCEPMSPHPVQGPATMPHATDDAQTSLASCTHFVVSRHTGRLHGFNAARGVHGRSFGYSGCSMQREQLLALIGNQTGEELQRTQQLLEFTTLFDTLQAAQKKVATAEPRSVADLRALMSKQHGFQTGSTRRYAPTWPTVDELCVPRDCLSFAWTTIASKRHSDTAQSQRENQCRIDHPKLPISLQSSRKHCIGYCKVVGPRNDLLCCCCYKALPCVAEDVLRSAQPGSVIELRADHVLFCSGECRSKFWASRSGKAIRTQLEAADGGVCASCGVDAGRLVDLLQAAESEDERLALILEFHPSFAADTTAAQRLAHNPTKGNAWHGDHVIPVNRGGGEAPLSNLQTLCVACHRAKTRMESARPGPV